MDILVQQIAQSARECPTHLARTARLTALSQDRLDVVKNSKSWSEMLVGSRDATALEDAMEKRHYMKAAQAWLCVHQALTVDSGLQHPLDDEFALQTVRFYAELDRAGCLLRYVKEYSAYCACLGFAQTETNLQGCLALVDQTSKLGIPVPAPGRLAWGWVGKRCDWVMAPRRRGGQSFLRTVFENAQNILYIKRGMPPAEPWEVEVAIEQHRQALSTLREDAPTKVPLKSPADLRDDVKVALRQLCREVFSSHGRPKVVDPLLTLPSMRACYERSRDKGGALVELATACVRGIAQQREDPDGLTDEQRPLWDDNSDADPALTGPTVLNCQVQDSTLYAMHWDPQLGVVETRAQPGVQAALDDLKRLVYNETQLRPTVHVLPAPVVEPCKVRMITMGSAASYSMALSLQKVLWSRMKKLPLFQWIGKPITEEDWTQAYPPDWCHELCEHGYTLNSGDYKGATDNLNPDLSRFAWDRVCENLRLPNGDLMVHTTWHDLGRRCLVEHQLHHGEKHPLEKNLEGTACGTKQAWGQLMGSPISFPILNLVNAACAAVALGWSKQEEGSILGFLDKFMVHTNGDDIAFVCPLVLYNFWKRVVSAAGLEPSIGKNYTSPSFLIINSEMRFLVAHDGPEGRRWVWEFSNFCNLPLLFGLEAKGPQAGQSILPGTAYFELGTRARALCFACDEGTSRRRAERFVEFHREALSRAPAGCVWEFPEHLGGLGLPSFRILDPPEGSLKTAAYLACLDTRTRLKFVTPPPRKPITPWEVDLKKAKGQEVVGYERVSAHTSDEQDFVAERLRTNFDLEVGGAGSGLGHWLLGLRSDPTEWKTRDEVTWQYLTSSDRSVERPKWVSKLRDEAVIQRIQREKRFSSQLMITHRKAQATSLEPMHLETVSSWSDRRVLQRVTYAASYKMSWSGLCPALS